MLEPISTFWNVVVNCCFIAGMMPLDPAQVAPSLMDNQVNACSKHRQKLMR